jgi:quercetin dioxygenase-like cupin family protein
MKKLVGGTALLAGFALLAIAATALATSGSGVTSSVPVQGSVDDIDVRVKTGDWKVKIDTKGPSTLAFTENKVAPGGHFGWHSHPGPSLVIVKSGTATFYLADDPSCAPHVVAAGSGFVDQGGDTHVVHNEGSVDLVTVVVSLVPAGFQRRIDEPSPGSNCPSS